MSNWLRSYCVVDVETTVRSERGSFRGTPHDPANEVVMVGTKEPLKHEPTIGMLWAGYVMLVGHNIGFDLLYLKKLVGEDTYNEWIAGKQIWDTQIAEYLLTGHKHKFSSLDSLAEKYGGTLKDSDIKEHWNRGGNTEDIPINTLKEYLFEDLINTELVFRAQLKELSKYPKLAPVLASAMEFRLATVEMEYNGLYFNQEIATRLLKDTNTKLNYLREEVVKVMAKRLSNMIDVNPNSNDQIALTIYGGTYTYKAILPYEGEDGELVRYKTGDRKGQLRMKAQTMRQQVGPWSINLFKDTTPTGKLKVDDHTLTTLGTKNIPTTLRVFILDLLQYRSLCKEVGTYLLPFSEEHTWPHDSCIHTTFNHAATATGRLSSSKPNLQNITRGGTGNE